MSEDLRSNSEPMQEGLDWRRIGISLGILVFLGLIVVGVLYVRSIKKDVTTANRNIGVVADTLGNKIQENANDIQSLQLYPTNYLADNIADEVESATAWTEGLFNGISFQRALNNSAESSSPLSQYIFDNFHDLASGNGGMNQHQVYKIINVAVSSPACLEILGKAFNYSAQIYFQLAPSGKSLATQEAQTWLHYLTMDSVSLGTDTTYYAQMVKKWHKRTSDEWRLTATQVCGDFITAMGASFAPSARGKSPVTTPSPSSHKAPAKATKKINF